jgi:hypothetical protein
MLKFSSKQDDILVEGLQLVTLLRLKLALFVVASFVGCGPPPTQVPLTGSSNQPAPETKANDLETEKTSTKKQQTSSDNDDNSDSESKPKLSGKTDTNKEEDTRDFGAFLTPKKLKECNDSGFVFDRAAQVESDTMRCHDAEFPAKFACTRAGIAGAFSDSAKAEELLAKYIDGGDKYEIDQCGSLDGAPFVFLIAVKREPNGDKEYMYRKLSEAPP